MNVNHHVIKSSLMRNLTDRTKQRRHTLKCKYWDHIMDKSSISRTPPKGLKNMHTVQWCALLDYWSTTAKQVFVFVHSSLLLFQFYNLDCCQYVHTLFVQMASMKAKDSRKKIMFPGLTSSQRYELSSNGLLNAIELFKKLQKGKTGVYTYAC